MNGCKKEDIEKILADNGYMKLFVNGKDLSIDIAKMVAMRTHGKSQTEIARLYGTTQPKISLLLNESAIEKKIETLKLEKIAKEQKEVVDTIFRGTDPDSRQIGKQLEWKKGTTPLTMQKEVVHTKLLIDGKEVGRVGKLKDLKPGAIIGQESKLFIGGPEGPELVGDLGEKRSLADSGISNEVAKSIAPAVYTAIANAIKEKPYATGGVLNPEVPKDVLKENADDVRTWDEQMVSSCWKPIYGENPILNDSADASLKAKEEFDNVNHPNHYGGANNPYEAIKVIDAWQLDFCLGNTVKYISRAGKKSDNSEIQDLEKAQFYLNHRIKQLKELSK